MLRFLEAVPGGRSKEEGEGSRSMQHSSRCISRPLVLPTHLPRGETRPGGRGGLREGELGTQQSLSTFLS